LGTADASAALEISELTKHYRTGLLQKPTRPALKGLSLAVPRGDIFGYLGPNGSGKTTTLKILMGLIFPDRGTARILGRPLADPGWRQDVGYLPEQPYLYDYLTAAEYLDYVGRLFGLPAPRRRERVAELLERVGLQHARAVPLRRFSKGMLQRIGLAQALVNDPALVFLDEPMSGLDPFGRRLVRDVILELKQRGRTVFFSTHILPDAEMLCDRVALLRSGELVKVGRLDEILAMDVSHMEVVATGIDEAALAALPAEGARRHRMGARWRLEVPEPALGAVVRAIETAGGRILSVQAVRESLEDYFFRQLAPGERGGARGLED
jgi:ABC-2 type transport system ATP-binding protein